MWTWSWTPPGRKRACSRQAPEAGAPLWQKRAPALLRRPHARGAVATAAAGGGLAGRTAGLHKQEQATLKSSNLRSSPPTDL